MNGLVDYKVFNEGLLPVSFYLFLVLAASSFAGRRQPLDRNLAVPCKR